MKKILISVVLFTAFIWWCSQQKTQESPSPAATTTMEVSAEHCKMMPDMAGCEKYNVPWAFLTGSTSSQTWTTTTLNHTMRHGDMVSDELSFISEMIPHHQEAIDSSSTLLAKTQNPKLKSILGNIIKWQTKEVTIMKERLSKYYSWSDYKVKYMPMMRDTSTISAISTLEKMYIEDMIAHHQGAVDMSLKILAIMNQQSPLIKMTEDAMKQRESIKTFAKSILQSQTKEIIEFTQLLSTY